MSALLVHSGFAVFASLMAAGAWLDLTRRLLPNLLCLAVALGGAMAMLLAGGWAMLGSSALHMLLALAGGMALFAGRMIGGGDAKFYAATALWFPLDGAIRFLLAVSLSGALLLIGWAIYRIFARQRGQGDFAKLPYGVAIALGAVAARIAMP